MLTEEQKQQFREQGYVILPEFIPADEIDVVTARIDRFSAEHEARLQQVGREGISRANEIAFTAFLAENDQQIMSFVGQSKFAELATDVLGPDVELYWNQSVYKKPETQREFPWHQDTGYVLTDPIEYLTCWLALVDVTVESGSIWIVPGSHHQGLLEHKNTDIGKQCYFGTDPGVPVPLKKGSLVAFSSLLFHRSGPNLSDGVRKGYVIQYSVVGARNGNTGEPFNRTVIARHGQPVLV